MNCVELMAAETVIATVTYCLQSAGVASVYISVCVIELSRATVVFPVLKHY